MENPSCKCPLNVNCLSIRGFSAGQPKIGSVTKMPAPISPIPANLISNGPRNFALSELHTCFKPCEKIINKIPVIIKFRICVQPVSPIESELNGYDNELQLGLIMPSIRTTIRNNGPAIAPQSKRGFVFESVFIPFFNKSKIECNQKQCKMNEPANEQKFMGHGSPHEWKVYFKVSEIPTCPCSYKKCTR